MVTDYGTNAEMALNVDGGYTGSKVAYTRRWKANRRDGNAGISGRDIRSEYEFQWRRMVLNEMIPMPGDKIDLGTDISLKRAICTARP